MYHFAHLPDLGINDIDFHKRPTPPNLPLGALIETSGFGLLIRPPLGLEGSLNKLPGEGWTLEDGGVDLQLVLEYVLRFENKLPNLRLLRSGRRNRRLNNDGLIVPCRSRCLLWRSACRKRTNFDNYQNTQSYSIILTKHFLLVY